MLSRRYLLICAVALVAISSGFLARGQDLKEQPTPFSLRLDFRSLTAVSPSTEAPPSWFSSLTRASTPVVGGASAKTVFRLRFRQIGALNINLLLRLFFDDVKDAGITVSGWSETGENAFQRGPFGNGLGLPTSEDVSLPMAGVDYIEISVAGDGAILRGAFLALLKQSALKQPIDFTPEFSSTDAFGNLPPTVPKDDASLFGRVKATIDPGIVTLTPATVESGSWQFELQSPPLLAVVTFDVLEADAMALPEVIVNNQPLGAATIHMPDLADPAYLGVVRPLERDMHFRYTGWLRAQKVIQASALQSGLNTVVIQLNKESGPIAIRAVGLQLKYNAPGLDFTVSNSAP